MTIADLKKYARKGIRSYIDEWRELAEQGVVREQGNSIYFLGV